MYFHSRAQQRRFCLQIILGSAAIFAASFFLGEKVSTTDAAVEGGRVSNSIASGASSFINTRFLRFSNFNAQSDPKTTASRTTKSTVTIYLARDEKQHDIFNFAHSVFKTDILQRYGSGRLQYLIREQAACNLDCKIDEPVLQHEPCLAVTRSSKIMGCDIEHLKCNYPQCKTMVTNDELCNKIDLPFDAREYYTSEMPHLGYLPLGPRMDYWLSFQKIQESHQFFIVPSSKRKYSFNAIFSQNTNNARKSLADNIDNNRHTSKLPIFTRMAKEWTHEVDITENEQLGTDEYMGALLDSIFTISPAGHSPECFRIFEAVEAGSIPVLSYDDMHGISRPNPNNRKDLRNVEHPCKNPLRHWYGAPIVVLDSWSDLYPTLDSLLKDPLALDEMQVKLRMWYNDYMQKSVQKFEDFVLDSSSSVAKEVAFEQ